ncbi:MAG TPA: glucokinase [Candidatus Binataceae bacterium]|nr:glucokinase [Candidatus Binataceae bacterium]
MILAGDIGGTHARLGLFDVESKRLSQVVESTFPSASHKTFEEIVAEFVAQHKLPVTRACFGIAGPIRKGRAEPVNLPWVVDQRELATVLHLETVYLINDLEANAYGVNGLEPHDFLVLNQGAPEALGNTAVIAAGTGLGEAGLYWDGSYHRPFATEGGHADFAPHNELEIDLLRYLQAAHGHVSWERVVSGPGLSSIYKFLRDTGHGEEPAWLAEAIRAHDASAVISQMAIEGRSPLCEQALDIFVSLYGAEAGNIALKFLAIGGVYIGGGIAPRIIEKLKGPAFMESFTSKGRLKPLLEVMPVRVILNDRAALLGAARCAALRAALL